MKKQYVFGILLGILLLAGCTFFQKNPWQGQSTGTGGSSYNTTTSCNTTYDGIYTVITCLSNGTVNVTGNITNATILLVAGGGSGYGYADGGGGGAGIIYLNANQTLSGNYNVTVGRGGIACSGVSCDSVNGSGTNSSFSNTTISFNAVGGGLGGIFQQAASKGGSGGGGGRLNVPNATGANGTAGQGYAGGNGSSDNGGGGGGGAGGQGGNSDGTNGGTGGKGINYTINGSTVCYGGGGGGGSRSGTAGTASCGGVPGTVGGAAGANATNNLGGGGAGGAGGGGLGSNGGSGVVIIRYLTLSVVYGTGIATLQFRPIHAFATNVQPVNQTASVPLFNVSVNTAGTYPVNISQTPAITGFTVRCAPNYNKTGLVTLNITSQWISDIVNPATVGIWCWADFSNPMPTSQSYNITVVQG